LPKGGSVNTQQLGLGGKKKAGSQETVMLNSFWPRRRAARVRKNYNEVGVAMGKGDLSTKKGDQQLRL